jgi:uncharacterized protein (DUF58 family)
VNALRAAIVRGARHVHAGGTIARGARPGDGYVFDRLRWYAQGDDPRRLDWSATARTGTLQTRVYLEETVLVLGAVVDESPSMRIGRKRALSAAAAEAVRAWFGAAETTDRTARIVDERLVGDRRGSAGVTAQRRFDLRRALEVAARVLQQGSSFLLITDALDLREDDGFAEVLLRIGRRFDATVLLARDPWIDGLPVRGFVRLRDAETARTASVFVSARASERYQRASTARDAAIRRRFERSRWRVGTLDEADGGASLERTFGLR